MLKTSFALLAAALVAAAPASAQNAGERYQQARKACEGRQGEARGACLRQHYCANAADPAQCEARHKAASERRSQAREACKDKEGEARLACLREQRGPKS